ncbi:MAG: response regulator transcription factor, partial [Jiangellaceae bacterium]
RLQSVSADAVVPQVQALAEYTAGLCSATDDAAALAHLEAALRGFATAGLPLEVVRTRLRIARLLASSNPAVAITEARAALSSCDRIGAGPDADAAAGILRSLGQPGRTPERTGATLTRRESEVLQHLVEGLSNEQIALRLYISKRTVEHHVGSILSKLAVSSRAEAMAHAVRHGLLTGEPG